MIILENTCIEITSRQYIDSIAQKKKTISHLQRCVLLQLDHQRELKEYLSVECLDQQLWLYKEKERERKQLIQRGYKLFLSEGWFEVVRVDCGIASILSFRIDILLFSESIQFGVKTTRIGPNDKVKLREILRPLL